MTGCPASHWVCVCGFIVQGYALKKRNFFKYFHYIFSFGFLGTLIQFITITVLALYASNSQYVSGTREGWCFQ